MTPRWLNPSRLETRFWGGKILGFSIGRRLGALKELRASSLRSSPGQPCLLLENVLYYTFFPPLRRVLVFPCPNAQQNRHGKHTFPLVLQKTFHHSSAPAAFLFLTLATLFLVLSCNISL